MLESLAVAKAIDRKSVKIEEGMRIKVASTVCTLLPESSTDTSEGGAECSRKVGLYLVDRGLILAS
jgi:hypothetical protein